MTRRTLIGGIATVAAVAQERVRPVEWKPRLGVLGPFTEANVRFAKEEGFTNMILGASRRGVMDPTTITDQQVEIMKQTLAKYGMHVSAFQASQNHSAPDLDKRKQDTDYFVKLIELAGKVGIPYIGTSSGEDADKPFEQRVDEIGKGYTERSVPARQANKVRIRWEPPPAAATIAIIPARL